MNKLRKLFIDDVKKAVKKPKGKTVGLLLSSGMDSLTAGAACELAGMNVVGYTFRMKGVESFDSKHARVIAEKLGWEFKLVEVPTDPAIIAKAFKWMHKNAQCEKKRDYECTYPMMYCYRQMHRDGIKISASGLVADAYFVFSRRANVEGYGGPKSDPKVFTEYRRKYWAEWFETGYDGLTPENNPSALLQHKILADKYGIQLVNPFLNKGVHDFLLQFDWLTLNKPKQKMHLQEAFADYVEKVGHRNHRGYQTEAKVPMYFEQLFDNPEINFNNRKRMIDIARDWTKIPV